MKDSEYRDVDRRHMLLLFDLIAKSDYDAFAMIDGYGKTFYRKRADEGEEYYILRQPVNSFNDVLLSVDVQKKEYDVDPVILHWIADVYLYAHYELGNTLEESMRMVSPKWLYDRYNPLHETSVVNAWEKAACMAKS